MLLNLSNHPSDKWSEVQMNAAHVQFGGVVDRPFPAIDPASSTDDVRMLVDSYVSHVRQDMRITAVHLMGEFTFCMQMALRLHDIGVPVYASTSTRNSVELKPGVKTIVFEFVQFRAYF